MAPLFLPLGESHLILHTSLISCLHCLRNCLSSSKAFLSGTCLASCSVVGTRHVPGLRFLTVLKFLLCCAFLQKLPRPSLSASSSSRAGVRRQTLLGCVACAQIRVFIRESAPFLGSLCFTEVALSNACESVQGSNPYCHFLAV